MLGVACFRPVLFGILLFSSCIGSRLLFPGFLSIIMVGVVLPLILWFGIREDLGRCVRLTLGFMSILLHCLGLVVS